jgi:DNA polymerase III epsilon subunit-like protein
MELVIFDLETTGLSPAANDIIQIAAVRVRLGTVVHSEFFSTFVNPGYRIPYFITSYTGISDSHVCHAPPAAEVLAAFSRFVGTSTLLAHNGHRFDMPFIHAACAKAGLQTRPVTYADSIHLSKRVWPDSRRHSLDMVIERLGLDTSGHRRHDARGDVGLLAEAVTRMWRTLTPDCASLPMLVFNGVLPVAGSPARPLADSPIPPLAVSPALQAWRHARDRELLAMGRETESRSGGEAEPAESRNSETQKTSTETIDQFLDSLC